MIYYGIKTPVNEREKSYISWVEKTEHDSWMRFFNTSVYRNPIFEARKAYEAIGYKCVKLEVNEIE